MVMSNLLTVNATESSSKTKSIMTEAIYDLKKGGIQNFQIRSKNDEIVYVTIEELTRTSRIANGTYQVTYTVPLAWKAGFKARISSNKFTKVYDPYYTVIAGAIRPVSYTHLDVYKRQALGDAGIHVQINAGGKITPIKPIEIKQGRLLADTTLQGAFEIVSSSHATSTQTVTIPLKDFIGKYVLTDGRTFTAEEEATIPTLPQWYVIPPEIKQICEHAKKTCLLYTSRCV